MIRVDIRAILADPPQRREMMVRTIVATQAREGIETTREQAEAAYDRVRGDMIENVASVGTTPYPPAVRRPRKLDPEKHPPPKGLTPTLLERDLPIESVEYYKMTDCSHYEDCMSYAAKCMWNQFHCRLCKSYKAAPELSRADMERFLQGLTQWMDE